MQNDHINIHKTKIITESKLKKYDRKSEYATKHVFWEQGVTRAHESDIYRACPQYQITG